MNSQSASEEAAGGSHALSAGRQLRVQAAALSDAVVACEFERHRELRARYGPSGRTKSRQESVDHFRHLAAAVDANSPALFDDHIGWVKVEQHHGGGQSQDLDHHLVCMAEAVREQMPPSVAAPAVGMIEGSRAALPAMPSTTASFLDAEQRLSPLTREYVQALLGGYRKAAGRVVFGAAERGESVGELYLQVFQPALREIGRLWHMKRITVAQEHFCSAATQVVMSQLLERAPIAERCGHTVVVVSVRGELHEVGARMVGDFFEMAGWDTYFCGASTPHAAVVDSVVERAADVLAVSATMGYYLPAVQELVGALRADLRCARVRAMVGGHPFNVDPGLWRTIGADGAAAEADAAVALANQWLAGSASTS
jgi:MerR family transcriptional regulator, light-induced transcriptional regulator